MQLKKKNLLKTRKSTFFTVSEGGLWHSRNGGYKTEAQMEQQMESRLKNPQDPINAA